ncbi:MAG TPA: hypothetical protein VJ692_06395 [Nitrospiraceae bacterium]|nr:hypothetical protein [Nitrospiraceae bacterium]
MGLRRFPNRPEYRPLGVLTAIDSQDGSAFPAVAQDRNMRKRQTLEHHSDATISGYVLL